MLSPLAWEQEHDAAGPGLGCPALLRCAAGFSCAQLLDRVTDVCTDDRPAMFEPAPSDAKRVSDIRQALFRMLRQMRQEPVRCRLQCRLSSCGQHEHLMLLPRSWA